MSQDFEKKAKQQGDEFMLTPREGVWQRIEAELDEKKRRRIVGWWWSLPALLLVGFGLGYYYFTYSTESISAGSKPSNNSITTIKTEKEKESGKQEISTQPQPLEKVKANKNVESELSQPGYVSNAKNKTNMRPSINSNHPTTGNDVTTFSAGKNSNTAKLSTAQENTIHQQQEETNKETGSVTQPELNGSFVTTEVVTANPASNDIQSNNIGLIEIVEPAPGNIPEENKILLAIDEDIVSNSIPAQQTIGKSGVIEIQKKKKINWYVLAGAGSTSLSTSNFLFMNGEKSLLSDPLASASPTPVTKSIPDKAGPGFSLALQRRQEFSKRWQWQLALGWQHQQIKQYLGLRVDTVFQSQNFSSNSTYYYKPGSNESVKGTNHRIYLANDFSWQVLKNKSWLRLYTGLYTGVNISNNYFVQDSGNRLIKNNDLYKKWFIGFTPGTEFIFKNNWTLGLNAHLDFTKGYTTLNGQSKYWRGWEIRAGIPLFKK